MLGKPVAPSSGGHGEVKKAELLDVMLDEVPEFREIFEEIDRNWKTYDLSTQSTILDKFDEILQIPAKEVV
jgi:hypothetical protein